MESSIKNEGLNGVEKKKKNVSNVNQRNTKKKNDNIHIRCACNYFHVYFFPSCAIVHVFVVIYHTIHIEHTKGTLFCQVP